MADSYHNFSEIVLALGTALKITKIVNLCISMYNETLNARFIIAKVTPCNIQGAKKSIKHLKK